MNDSPSRGEVWWCELDQIGRRPVVVLSRDVAIPRHRRALVAPCTTTVPGETVVVTVNGRGVVMRPDALRPATAKAAAGSRNKLKRHGQSKFPHVA